MHACRAEAKLKSVPNRNMKAQQASGATVNLKTSRSAVEAAARKVDAWMLMSTQSNPG